ncbi:PAP11 [Scenedesmus sp. PABB004]|nr:PAP11 [Scenedesmus sp. PABB004]
MLAGRSRLGGCAPPSSRSSTSSTSSSCPRRGAAARQRQRGAAACAAPPPALEALLADVRSVPQGAPTPPGTAARILARVAELRAATAGAATTGDAQLSATWRLLWTTEKETRFIVETVAPLFGTAAGGVFQVIDVAGRRLQNVITFPPDGAFVVDSSIAVQGPQRVAFEFNAVGARPQRAAPGAGAEARRHRRRCPALPAARARGLQAKLKAGGRDWGVPPFGKGWFDTVYVDERYRVAQDVRGDTLIVERDGPPRIF